MKTISIEEHQRLMHELHTRTRDSVYREMDMLVKEHDEPTIYTNETRVRDTL